MRLNSPAVLEGGSSEEEEDVWGDAEHHDASDHDDLDSHDAEIAANRKERQTALFQKHLPHDVAVMRKSRRTDENPSCCP